MAMTMYIYLCICKNMDMRFVAGVEVKCFPFVHLTLCILGALKLYKKLSFLDLGN